MTILGKVLIVFNLLAAGAFAYFTLEDLKVRKELTKAAFVREIQLRGVPVDSPAVPPTDLDATEVAFPMDVSGTPYDRVPKATLDAAIPKGDELYGGGAVYTQTEEVKRVKDKVFAHVQAKAAGNQDLRFQWLRAYGLAVARTGAERDGVNAVFDMRDPSRAYAARRDLPLAARTASQTAALRALIDVADLGDPQAIPELNRPARIATAREGIKRFALGEAEHGAADEEGRRRLRNAVLAAFQPGAGEAERNAIAQAATDKPFQDFVAPVAVESLSDKASAERAAKALLDYARARAIAGTKAEGDALDAVAGLIRLPVTANPDPRVADPLIDTAGTNLLTARFEAAALPAGSKTDVNGNPAGEKARRIAHLLYHIDGWRYADPAAAAARKAWHERVATVVGLPAYVRAAESQATEYAEAAQRLVAAITEEQSAFEAEYQAQLQRILFLYSQFQTLDAQLKAQNVVTAENVRLMEQRKSERNDLLTELAKAREDAKASLDKLTKTQKDLFTIQSQLRDAQEALLVLEKQLRDLELKDE